MSAHALNQLQIEEVAHAMLQNTTRLARREDCPQISCKLREEYAELTYRSNLHSHDAGMENLIIIQKHNSNPDAAFNEFPACDPFLLASRRRRYIRYFS